MKALLMFGTLILTGIGLYLFYDKVSIMKTYFDLDSSPKYVDLIFLLIGLQLAITRGVALFSKLF